MRSGAAHPLYQPRGCLFQIKRPGLSERRAAAVNNWLVKNGYTAAHLQITGFGKKKPVADNSTEEGRKLNRRVEIRTMGLKE
jgi:outer membrane protein OmpA-like peptidoglycan-associated protein